MKTYEEIVHQIQRLASSENINIKELEEVERLAESYLRWNPSSVDLWLRLALLEFIDPIGDYPKCINYLKQALKTNCSSELIILLAFIQDWYGGGLDKQVLAQLMQVEENDSEIKSMAYYLIAWSYQHSDILKFEAYLQKSIEACPKHVKNFVDLGRLYIKGDKVKEGKELISRGLNNILKVYPVKFIPDVTDINQFLNERIKGIHIAEENLNSLKALV